MKKLVLIMTLLFTPFLATTTYAGDFFGGNDGEWKMGPNGPYWDESDWPEWTPMYWMEEFMDAFDDDDDYYGYGGGYGSNFGGYGMPYGNQMPYGYGMPGGAYNMPPMPNMPYVPAN